MTNYMLKNNKDPENFIWSAWEWGGGGRERGKVQQFNKPKSMYRIPLETDWNLPPPPSPSPSPITTSCNSKISSIWCRLCFFLSQTMTIKPWSQIPITCLFILWFLTPQSFWERATLSLVLTRSQGYKTFFMLSSGEHEILTAHTCRNSQNKWKIQAQ